MTMILNPITCGEVPSFVDDMVSHHNMLMRTFPPNLKKLSLPSMPMKWSQARLSQENGRATII